MQEMTMVERVARAICRAHGKWIEDESWHTYQDEARAAIEAMREPDQNIIEEIRSLGGDVAVAYWLAGHETMIKSTLSE